MSFLSLDNLAAFKNLSECVSGFDLSFVGTNLLNAIPERLYRKRYS